MKSQNYYGFCDLLSHFSKYIRLCVEPSKTKKREVILITSRELLKYCIFSNKNHLSAA